MRSPFRKGDSMKVLKNGKDKAFYSSCISCGSELEYTLEDVKEDKKSEFKNKYIICPVCGEKLIAGMETKEELEMWKFRALRAFACSCSN